MRDAEYLRDLVVREVYKPSHVSSAEQRADIFTKQLTRMSYLPLRGHLVDEVA